MAAAVERAHKQLRDRILSHQYPAGTHLGAADLAREFNISRTPVREALYLLQAEGLVNIVPNQGAYVSGFSIKDLEEIFSLRAKLESFACRSAVKNISEADINRLHSLDLAMREQIARRHDNYLENIRGLNTEFHGIIFEIADNKRLIDFSTRIREAQLVKSTIESYTPEELDRSMSHHSEIVLAYRSRDEEWAEAVMFSHVKAAAYSAIKSGRAVFST